MHTRTTGKIFPKVQHIIRYGKGKGFQTRGMVGEGHRIGSLCIDPSQNTQDPFPNFFKTSKRIFS